MAEKPKVRVLPWNAAQRADPIEVFARNELLARFPDEYFDEVERLQFHLVVLGVSGVGIHEVDFVDTEVRPSRVLHMEPGQVHRWRRSSDFDATLVLFADVPVGSSPRWGPTSTTFDLDPSQGAAVDAVLDLIDDEARIERSPAAREIALRSLRDLLFVRLGLDQDHGPMAKVLPDAYVAFRSDLESHLSVAVTMTERAERIGYSARTVSRACLHVQGQTAKQMTNERLTLEARRLLVQPGMTSAEVAAMLGFSEPTNFAKFFRRHTTFTPSQWVASPRSSHRS